jgi:hypothetical protein
MHRGDKVFDACFDPQTFYDAVTSNIYSYYSVTVKWDVSDTLILQMI